MKKYGKWYAYYSAYIFGVEQSRKKVPIPHIMLEKKKRWERESAKMM